MEGNAASSTSCAGSYMEPWLTGADNIIKVGDLDSGPGMSIETTVMKTTERKVVGVQHNLIIGHRRCSRGFSMERE